MPPKTPTGPPKSGGLARFFNITPTKQKPAVLPGFEDEEAATPISSAPCTDSKPVSPPTITASPSLPPSSSNTVPAQATNTIPPSTASTPTKSSLYKPRNTSAAATPSAAPAAVATLPTPSPVPAAAIISTPTKPSLYNKSQASSTPIAATTTTTTPNTPNTPAQNAPEDKVAAKTAAIKRKFQQDSSSGYSGSSSDSSSSGSSSSFASESDEDEKPAPKRAANKSVKRPAPAKKTARAAAVSTVATDDEMSSSSGSDDDDDDDSGSTTSTVLSGANMTSFFESYANGAAQQSTNASDEAAERIPVKLPKTTSLTGMPSSDNDSDDDDDDDAADQPSATQKTTTSTQNKSSNTSSITPTSAVPQKPSSALLNIDYELPSFVHPDNIRDAQRRRPDHPDYDPRTLYVPDIAKKDMSPGQKQFWEIKSQNMDTVLLFKVGKFYELFDLDAEVGVKELSLARMGTESRLHVGFPEAGYLKYATELVQRGYRVACAEQTQTPDQMKAENAANRGKPAQKIVRREICSFVTPGTAVVEEFLQGKASNYLLAIVEQPIPKGAGVTPPALSTAPLNNFTFKCVQYTDNDTLFGICFVDTSTGAFTVGSFIDDTHKTAFKTLLAQIDPAEVLLFKNGISSATENILQNELSAKCVWTYAPVAEKLDSARCIAQLNGARYFIPTKDNKMTSSALAAAAVCGLQHRERGEIDPVTSWPIVLQQARDQYEQLNEYLELLENADDPANVPVDQLSTELASIQPNQRLSHVTISLQQQDLFWNAFGIVLLYLKRVLLDKELIPLSRFSCYQPHRYALNATLQQALHAGETDVTVNTSNDDNTAAALSSQVVTADTSHSATSSSSSTEWSDEIYNLPFDSLLLDAQTLENLDILINSDGTKEGTLLQYLDHCKTPFGKRLLRKWITKPLGNITAINNRLDCVEEMLQHMPAVKKLLIAFSKLPDLERILSRIRANGLKKDTEPIMYENIGKIKVKLFLQCLDGFHHATHALHEFIHNDDNHTWKSAPFDELALLRSAADREAGLLSHISAADQDKMQSALEKSSIALVNGLIIEFREAFDATQALNDGFITPRAGVLEDHDVARRRVDDLEAQFNQLLQQYRQKFGGSHEVKWVHKNRERYQLEIPNDLLKKYPSALNNTFSQLSSTTKVKRYHTPTIISYLDELNKAQDELTAVLQDVTRQVFEKFSVDYHIWVSVLDTIAVLDCLSSLAITAWHQSSQTNGQQSCRPVLHSITQQGPVSGPLLQLRGAIHPTVVSAQQFDTSNNTSFDYSSVTGSGVGGGAIAQKNRHFIPNDTDLGTEQNSARFVLVSGPNMGGKSTLLRQVCCCIILAQIGCFVPAQHMELTPVDRIFTRVGASDRIMQGQSTFLVELEETAHILRHATPRSFVILDELGRGTSTFDGAAIAHSVIQYLVHRIRCMTLFSTHYHMLLQEYASTPGISLYHMACKVHGDDTQTSNNTNQSTTPPTITFLYKFVPGACNKSFGLHVASLAKLPPLVIQRACEMSRLFEQQLQVAHHIETEPNSHSLEENNQQPTLPTASKAVFETNDSQASQLLKRTLVALLNEDVVMLHNLYQQFERSIAVAAPIPNSI